VTVSEVCHDFGVVTPGEELKTEFLLSNPGSTAVLLGEPGTSCRCTTTTPLKGLELGPGETRRFGVSVTPARVPAQRHSISLTFFEKGTGESKRVNLWLVASSPESAHWTPPSLDFGQVVPGKQYSRTVTISEVSADRFVLKKIDTDDLPLAHEVAESKDGDGLCTYRIRLTLKPDDSWSGEHAGELCLVTDSRVQPRVTIPVRFEIAPVVRAVPSVVSLGTAVVGELRERRVRLVSRSGEAVTVKIVSVPKECSVEVDQRGRSPELIVRVKLNAPGIWQDIIRGNVRTASTEEAIEIRCVGYGKESS